MRVSVPIYLLLLSLCALASGCGSYHRGKASLDLIGQETGLTFPERTVVVESYYEFGPGQGRYLIGRLSLTKTGLATLLQTVSLIRNDPVQIPNSPPRRSILWWRPQAVLQARSASYVRQNGDAVFLLIGMQDQQPTAYVYVSGG